MGGFPNLDNWREMLPPKVRLSADDLSAQMQGFLGVQHNADGSHGNITTGDIDAEGVVSIVSSGDFIRGYTPLPNGNRDPAFVITHDANSGFIVETDAGRQLALGVDVGLITVRDKEQQLAGATTVLGKLNLFGQGDDSSPGLDLFQDNSAGPRYSYYRVTPLGGGAFSGIFTLAGPGEGRGQVIAFANVSARNLTLLHNQSSTPANRRILTPTGKDCIVGPGGAVVVIFDIALDRWRVVNVSYGGVLAYTPTWTSTGVAPAIVDGTIGGLFQQTGESIRFVLNQVMGASDTFGTGEYLWSLPVPIPTSYAQAIPAIAVDNSTGKLYAGLAIVTDATHLVVISTNPAGATSHWGVTDPFTWAAGDRVVINGEYFMA